MSLPNDILTSLLSLLEEAGSYVLATPEDANYFRTAKRIQQQTKENVIAAPAPKPIERELPITVIDTPLPKPIVMTAPLPSKPSFKEVLPPLKPIEELSPKEGRDSPTAKGRQVPCRNWVDSSANSALNGRDCARAAVHKEDTPSFSLSAVRHLLSIVAPELAILNDIPNDDLAKKIADRWKTKNQSAPISILLFQEPPEQRALLEQIARALDVYFGPAKIVNAEKIEKDKQWEAFLSVADLKIVIVCDHTLWQLSHLMQFYKETPASGVRTLGNVPLFLLPDLSLYLKDPLLKRSLWKALCQKIT